MNKKYCGDLICTDANTDFMKKDNFISSYEEVKKTDTRGYLGDYDIRWRIHTILWAASTVKNLEGDFVDCGGGFGFFMSSIYKYLDFEKLNKKYYMFDSFSGTSSEFDSKNHFTQYGSWYTDIVKNHGNKKNLEIIQGYLPQTLSNVDIEKISFLSIDLNSYKPEIECMNLLWDKIVTGGVIVLDDYGFPGCENQLFHHNEFIKTKNKEILTLPTGQGLIIK
jgi:hypothetical protein